ncbi:hypothetical protein ACMU_18225 [Actibacterium mucosum KCTC 23349]|uniref:Twin-arginine translocation pathway signal n=1 Tax=Actibacterium mucosum KCTC 23349 TaxID=1454373 RepID=A0A037ZHV0_9RHOB|nr:DUF1513 domain-containing protein [Actibacterium mucosum]KAJ54365.1 hypothetical protein ACMU_18225 [Actibacterium mucosum KCTC 23349]
MATDMRRRGFLAGAVASVVAQPTWANAGSPALLSALNDTNNNAWLVGLTRSGTVTFRLPIPGRGHAAAAHPSRPVAVAFARRPGRFAVVIDCAEGVEAARLSAPEGRHFYGHGAFTEDGRYLLTTENAFDDGQGRIGVWDAGDRFKRLDDLPSGGVGPHEILRLPNGGFAVANGGIQTHPNSGRTRLNVPTMRTNLAFLDPWGAISNVVEAPDTQRQNSIRHIDADAVGRIAIALQWQGDPRKRAPVAAMLNEQGLTYLEHPATMRLKHYGGSVAIAGNGQSFFVTGPKGDSVLSFDMDSGAPLAAYDMPLASGVATFGSGVAISSSSGIAAMTAEAKTQLAGKVDGVWDNHLVRL